VSELLLDPEARLRVMREAAAAFSGSSGAQEAAQRLSELVVPRFADWCAVDRMVDGRIHRLAVAHQDPSKVQLAIELQERWPPNPDHTIGVPQVLRTGKPELVPQIPATLFEDANLDPEHLSLIMALGLESYVVLPLHANDEVQGTLTLVHAESGRHFASDQMPALEDIAALAGIALQSSILVDELHQALHESKRQAEMLSGIVDNLPTLAWTARPDGFIYHYNRGWYEYTGCTPEEMQGWGWEKVHDPALLPEVKRRWTHAIDTGTPFEMEFTLRSATGERRWFLTRVRPVRDAEGVVMQWIGTNTDIEDLKRTSALVDMVHEQSAMAAATIEQLQHSIEQLEADKAEARERITKLEERAGDSTDG